MHTTVNGYKVIYGGRQIYLNFLVKVILLPGIKFSTPDNFFLGDKEGAYALPEFNPASALTNTILLEPSTAVISGVPQEAIVMVGFPGSGKSYFSLKHLTQYERINRDILGSWQKCVAM